MLMRGLRWGLLASASCLLYFGLWMLLLVPGVPGEPYWARGRVLYGFVPLLAGLSLSTVCGRLALERPNRHEFLKLVARYWLYAFCGVPVVFGLLCLKDLWISS